MTSARAAVAQMTATPDVEANLACAERAVARAAVEGAVLVMLPEGFAYIGPDAGKRGVAETLPPIGSDAVAEGGPVLARIARAAREHRVEVVAGGFWEAAPGGAPPYNACFHVDVEGVFTATYRKIHLFDVDLPDGTSVRESAGTSAGEPAVVVAATACGPMGLSVCYDLRFPELYRLLVDRGAKLLAVPSAFTKTTGEAHWHLLLRARAVESQCWVLAAAQQGRHFVARRPDGREMARESYGHALVVDPWGEVAAEVTSAGEGMAVADIDLDHVERVRASLPSLRHRRIRVQSP